MAVDRTILFWCVFLSVALCVRTLPLEERALRQRREVAESLMRQTYDFSTTCPGGIILKLGDTQINSRNLQLSQTEAEAIAPVLYEQAFQDQVDVWCKVAKLTQELAASIGRNVNTFDVETLQLYQGDIVLTKNTVNAAVDYDENPRKQRTLRPTESNPDFAFLSKPRSKRHNVAKRKVISDRQYYWTGANVPWYFDENALFLDSDKVAIRTGIAHWEENTCIKFPELTQKSKEPHLRFIKGRGCYSYIGKDPMGQPVSIGDGCTRLGIVAHEIGHALGFAHEQSRPDRNRYVRINFSNVWVGFEANFYANKWNFFETEGIPYDYASVMHYAARDFARDVNRDTVESVDPAMRETLGQREGLSFWDVRLANTWYCSDTCGGDSLDWDRCEHNGYRNPKNCDECVCPPGWAPPFCEDPLLSETCGSQTLSADNAVKTFSSPGFDEGGLEANTRCNYRITAPANMRLRLKFVNDFSIEDVTTFVRKPTCASHVELRYKNMALTGPRFCGSEMPRGEFVSHGDEVLVSLTNLKDKNTGFMLEYSAESCGGCSSSSQEFESACLRTVLYDCDDDSTPEEKHNHCFDVAADNKLYCCSGFKLNGDNCQSDPVIETTTTAPTTTTAAPTTTTAAPTTTTAAPTTTTTAPTTTTAAPTTTTVAQTTTAPTTTTAAPTTTTSAPTTTTSAPTTTTAAPTTTTAAPTTTTAAPTTTTTAPTTTTAAPTTTTAAPTTTSAAPTTTTTAPTTTIAPSSEAPAETPSSEAPTETPTTSEAPTTTETLVAEWKAWTECRGQCGFCGRQGRQSICNTQPCDEFIIPENGPKSRRILTNLTRN